MQSFVLQYNVVKFYVLYAMYCNCNFKRMIIIKKPMLWLSSMATMHDQDFPVFLLGERREGAEREWNL